MGGLRGGLGAWACTQILMLTISALSSHPWPPIQVTDPHIRILADQMSFIFFYTRGGLDMRITEQCVLPNLSYVYLVSQHPGDIRITPSNHASTILEIHLSQLFTGCSAAADKLLTPLRRTCCSLIPPRYIYQSDCHILSCIYIYGVR